MKYVLYHCENQNIYGVHHKLIIETDYVNVHNVRLTSFGNNELSFILVVSFLRLIEISKDAEIILNDRIEDFEDNF